MNNNNYFVKQFVFIDAQIVYYEQQIR